MLQTTGQMDLNFTKIILAEIAELRKMPHLAKAIRDYQPQPDPLEQELKMLELEYKKALITNEYAKAAENEVDVNLKSARAANKWSKSDMNKAKTRATHSEADRKKI